MQTYSCLLCKRSDRECIRITYKNGGRSVEDDILEFCGNSIQQYLESNALMCSKCIKVLDNATRLKRQVCEIIIDLGTMRHGGTVTKALNLSKVWDVQVSSAHQHLSYEEANNPTSSNLVSPNNLPSSPCSLRTSPNLSGTSPNNLLMPIRSTPYDQRSNSDIEEANNKYQYYSSSTPGLDIEVRRTNSRRRRRSKGHRWTKRKGSQRSRNSTSASQRSRSRSRSHSIGSDDSRNSGTSYKPPREIVVTKKQQTQKQLEKTQLERILSDFQDHNPTLKTFSTAFISKYLHEDVGSLDLATVSKKTGTSEIRTRFASEIRQQVLAEYNQLVYECHVNSCSSVFENLNVLTKHRISEHGEVAYFFCNHCKEQYLSQEHLDKHQDEHDKEYLSFCIYCSEPFVKRRLYTDHLNEHLLHSFPCSYCDKFFIRKQFCDDHIRLYHPGKKQKIKRLKRHSILDRIDKQQKKKELKSYSPTSSTNPKPFIVKVLLQHQQPEITNNLEDLCISNVTESTDTPKNDDNIPSTSQN